MSNLQIAVGVVEEDVELTLADLCRASRAPEELVRVWVVEGVLQPRGRTPEEWRFVGPALRRAKVARALALDMEINACGVALALDLLDQIAALRGAQNPRVAR